MTMLAQWMLGLSNPDAPAYPRAALQPPTGAGYVYLAAELDPPARPGPVRDSALADAAIARAQPALAALRAIDAVHAVDVFHAAGFPPLGALPIPDAQAPRVARWDVIALIEAADPAAAEGLRATAAFAAFAETLTGASRRTATVTARNVKRIAEPVRGDRLHLFNHFLTDVPGPALDFWDHLAGWYQAEMKLTNSMVLAPTEAAGAPFAFVNHASWDLSVGRFIAAQMSRRSFRSYVLAGLRDREIGTLPFLYRRVA